MEKAIEMLHITKSFRSVIANNDVSLCVQKGTVHAIIGENGAGKTTLMNVLYGLYMPDHGKILIDGVEQHLRSATDAIACGIGMVHQHFTLIPRLLVVDNIVLGAEPCCGIKYNQKEAVRKVQAVCTEYGLNVDLMKPVREVSLGMQQRVEIIKALYKGASIIILDEPTAVLTPQEIIELGHTLQQLKQKNKTILVITHKLEEVMDFSDEITVLRNGRHVITVEKKDTDIPTLSSYMVGHEVKSCASRVEFKDRNEMLRLNDVCFEKSGRVPLHSINLSLYSGEILGIAGIDGSGQTELTELIAGILPCSSGNIWFGQENISNLSIAERKQKGIGFIPQDRHKHGLILPFSIEENLILGLQRQKRFVKNKILQNKETIRKNAMELVQKFDIRPADESLKASILSGGNQQKIIIAREISNNPDLIIADQPTRGVDIGAIESIHAILMDHRNRGGSVILASLELDEVLSLSDRIAVMYSGRIIGILNAEDATREKIGLMMVGHETKEASV